MRKLMLIGFLGFVLTGFGQPDSIPKPPYLKSRRIPDFMLLLPDSINYFYGNRLKKNIPTVIIYFNPDCSHCQLETKHLTDSMAFVKNAQFVFASYSKFEEIKQFDSTYQLYNFPNIIIGRDEKYSIPPFYKVRFTPFVAVYSKKGFLMGAFEGGTPISNLARLLKQK
jgi:thiol-disulfide isomerase/thioredoxin